MRLSLFSLRNNIESSQLKIKCYDVLVLAKFLLSTAFSTAMSSAGEARLTDKILKGFFFKTSLLHSRVPPFLSICFFLSLSKCTCAFACLLARARKAKSRPRFFLGSEKRIQKCCEKFSFGDANCPRPPH